MRTNCYTLLVLVWLFLHGVAQADAFDRALAQVGLTKASARFNPLDVELFGGGEYRLQFFNSLFYDPWRVPFVAEVVRRDTVQNAEKVAELVSAASLRLSEGTRRTLISDPIQPIQRRVETSGQPLREAVELIYREAGQTPPRSPSWQQQLSSVPISVQKPAAIVLLAAIEAFKWRERAFRKAFAQHSPQALYEMLCPTPSAAKGIQDYTNTPYWDLMQGVDQKSLFAGAQDLVLAVERAVVELKKHQITGRFGFRVDTPYGVVTIQAGGNNTYRREPFLLIVDLNGDDTYIGTGGNVSAQHPIAIVIDLQGKDRYLQTPEAATQPLRAMDKRKTEPPAPCHGGAVLGYAIVVDAAGDDLYRSFSVTQGAAVFGVGVLVDASGNDTYDCYTEGQGSAHWGIGLLVDRTGNDHYTCFSTAQGYGATKGYGLLLDVSGSDVYTAEDQTIDFPSPQTDKHNVSMAQGAGYGRRADFTDGHSLAGGIGMLVDGAGDDRYACGVFGQGVGYWYGLGMLCDGDGNDVYEGVWYVQGAAAHFAIGVLSDKSGNDRYTATMNMAQGAGHDFSLGWLADLAGDDQYRAPNLSLGGGNANGIGILWDASGNDRYEVAPSITLGRSNIGVRGTLRERALCLGLFCDTGGQDTYPESLPFARNDTLWTQPGGSQPPMQHEYGVGIDCTEQEIPFQLI